MYCCAENHVPPQLCRDKSQQRRATALLSCFTQLHWLSGATRNRFVSRQMAQSRVVSLSLLGVLHLDGWGVAVAFILECQGALSTIITIVITVTVRVTIHFCTHP